MIVDVAGGRVSFRRYMSLGVIGAIPDGVDGDPGQRTLAVISDAAVNPTHVSLKSPAVRLAAVDFTITDMGNIRKVGWVNIIQASDRKYHYADGLVVTERVNDLPTWDGGDGGLAPFYFGSWWGTADGDDDLPGCVGVLGEDNPEDLIFNDDPCMPPTYNVTFHSGIHLGKFNISPPGYLPNYMVRISGSDRYVAALTVIAVDNSRTVIWEVPWDVSYIATVTRHAAGYPVVTLDGAASTRMNIAPTHNIAALITASVDKVGSQQQKRYESNRAGRLVRDIVTPGLRRTMSTGDLLNKGY